MSSPSVNNSSVIDIPHVSEVGLTYAANSGVLGMTTVVLEVAIVGAVGHIQFQSSTLHIIQHNRTNTLSMQQAENHYVLT